MCGWDATDEREDDTRNEHLDDRGNVTILAIFSVGYFRWQDVDQISTGRNDFAENVSDFTWLWFKLKISVNSFLFYIFFWLHVLRVLTTLSFLVQVKLFCRIVSYRVSYIFIYLSYLILCICIMYYFIIVFWFLLFIDFNVIVFYFLFF